MQPLVALALVGGVACAVLPWINYGIAVVNRPTRIAKVWAHRGNGFGHPENTLPGVQAAQAAGFAVEIDLVLSKSGKAWMIHDSTLDRTTSCTGAVKSKSDTELRECGLITLDDVLDATTGDFLFDLKSPDLALVDLVVAAATPGREFAVFFDLDLPPGVVAERLRQYPVVWALRSMGDADRYSPHFDPAKDVYGIDLQSAWSQPRLLRWITTQLPKKLYMWFSCGENCHVEGAAWMIIDIPVTHAELDDPVNFETLNPAPTMPEVVYRWSGVGTGIAVIAGWVARGRWGTPKNYYAVKM